MSAANIIFLDNEDKIRPWDGNAGPSLPDGEYAFEIVEARADTSRAGSPVIFTRFRVYEGEFGGTEFQKRYVIQSDKDAAIGRTIHFLRACGLEKNAQGGYDLNDLMGRRIYANVQRRDRPMVNQQTGETEVKTMADLVNERPYDEANSADYQEQAAVSTPAPAAGSTQRRAVAAKPNGSTQARR